MTSLRFVERLSDLVNGVEVILSDIWGVVHNGLESFPEACEALHTYRQRGGTVILITNAPRPADSVQRQLRKLGVADDTYDAIVSSGDLTRSFVADHPDVSAQAQRLESVLKDAGIPAKRFSARETNHDKLNDNLGLADDPATKALFEFVDDVLKK